MTNLLVYQKLICIPQVAVSARSNSEWNGAEKRCYRSNRCLHRDANQTGARHLNEAEEEEDGLHSADAHK